MSLRDYPSITSALEITPTAVWPNEFEPIVNLNVNRLQAIDTLGLGQPTRLVWSRDGSRLAVATPYNFWLYNADVLNRPPKLIEQREMVTSDLAFSPDGKQLAVIGTIYDDTIPSGVLFIWDLESNHSQEVKIISDRAPRLAFTENQILLGSFSNEDKTIYITDLVTGSTISHINADDISKFEFGGDGRLIAYATLDNQVRVFDLIENREKFSVTLDVLYNQIAFSPDSKLIAIGGLDGGVQIWDWETNQLHYQSPRNLGQPVIGLAFDPQGKVLAESRYYENDQSLRRGTIRFVDPTTGDETIFFPFEKHSLEVDNYYMQLTFAPDGQRLVANWTGFGGWGETQMWEISSGHELRLSALLPYHPILDFFEIDSVFTPDNSELLFLSEDGVINRWHIGEDDATPTSIGLNVNFNSITKSNFSHNAQILASGGKDGRVYFWDTQTGDLLQVADYQALITALAFSQDDMLLAVGTETGEVFLWNLQTQSNEAILKATSKTIYNVVFSPDGRWLATADNSNFRLWDMESKIVSFEEVLNCYALVFSPDSNLLTISSKSGSFIWEVSTQAKLAEISDSSIYISSLAFSPDGTLIAGTDLTNYTVHLWDSKTGEILANISQDAWPSNLEFGSDGRLLAIPTNVGTITIYGIASE